MQISQLKQRLKRSPLDESDILPLAFVGLAIGEVILAFGLIWVGHSVSQLSNKAAPTLVQKVDGQAFAVRAADHDYREPEVIRQLVHEWTTFTYTWSGKLPASSGSKEGNNQAAKDEGIPSSDGLCVY